MWCSTRWEVGYKTEGATTVNHVNLNAWVSEQREAQDLNKKARKSNWRHKTIKSRTVAVHLSHGHVVYYGRV